MKHQNALGKDEESVQVALLSTEYPAPLAVANTYINSDSTLKTLQAKRRGCVISKIADRHAKEEAYGSRGGPYDETLIQYDVHTFASACR